MTGENIFISHASVNRPIADLFKNTLVLGGVPAEAIFYSSTPSTGVPIGDNFRQHLRTRITESSLVVQLISKEFVQRHWCLFEVGAAWALDSSTYPVVLPPMTRADASFYLGETSTGILEFDRDVDAVFSELSDRIQQNFAFELRVSSWNEAVQNFKDNRAVAQVASQGDDEQVTSEPGTHTTTEIRRTADIDERTMQEQIAPFLDSIRKRQSRTEIFVRIPGNDAWLGFSTSAIRQFGMDSNTIHIYYRNPVGESRPRLDTVASWNEEMSLGRLLEVIRRIFNDDPEKRAMANFSTQRVIEDLQSALHEISGV